MTSISIGIPIEGSCELLWGFVLEGNDIFAEILLGTTIWDGSKKERSNGHILLHHPRNQRKGKEKRNSIKKNKLKLKLKIKIKVQDTMILCFLKHLDNIN